MRNALRLMLVALLLWGRQLCPAAEPLTLAEAMEERSALGKALTNQFVRRGGEASAQGSATRLNLAAALLLVTAFAALQLAPRLKRRFSSWNPKLAGPDDLAPNLLEEPSVAEFFEALKAGPAELPSGTATPPDLLREFYDSAPRHHAELRKLFSEVSLAPDEPARRTKLLGFCQQVGALRERARLPELLPVRQLALGLEGLLKQLSIKAVNVTPSLLRTTAGALDLLGDLCSRRSRPDLTTEPPIRLLAVDDDPISRRAVSLALAKAFKEPDLAPEGQAALELAGRQTYDAIFLDVQMPGMDGFELCSRIHDTERNRRTPVVFVTCQDDFASRARVTVLGAQDLISKPFFVFEIALKALTVVMRARLGHSAAETASAGQPEAASAAPGVLASPAAATSGAVALLGQSGLSAGQDQTPPSGSVADNTCGGEALLSPPPSPAAASALRELSPGGLSIPAPPWRQEAANAFFTQASAQIDELRRYLVSAQEAEPGRLHEPLSDLYLSTHGLCSEAGRAQLSAAQRLASALEAMFKKLLDCPNLCIPSTLDAAAGALDVLDELCRARTDPDLARPAVRLLVVDDDPVARRAITMSLQLVFGRPESAESGEAALALARKREFDLIFLDVRMPGLDGYTACSQIHATALNRLTPVVFVTNHGDTASRAEAAAAGGCGFIPKPVLASQIALVALSYILHGRLARQLPATEGPSSLIGSGPEPASPEFAGATAAGARPRPLAWPFHTGVAADVSRRQLGGGQNAPTDVGGYTGSANRAEGEISGLEPAATVVREENLPPADSSPEAFGNAVLARASAHMGALQGVLQVLSRTVAPEARRNMLKDMHLGLRAFTPMAELANLRFAFQISSALEELLDHLAEKPEDGTEARLETVASALGLLTDLCERGSTADGANHSQFRALVVDEDPMVRQAIAGALPSSFQGSDSVASWEEGLALTREKRFDLIFGDADAPGLAELEVCSSIHEPVENRQTPVVLSTRWPENAPGRPAAWREGQAYITKPFLGREITVKALTLVLRGRA